MFGLVHLITGELTFLNDIDKSRLKKVVQLAEPISSNTLSSIYYNVNLNSILDKSYAYTAKVCAHISKDPADSLESIYFITSTAKILGSCQLDANKLVTKLQSFVKDDITVPDLHRVTLSLSNLGKPIDSTKFSKLLLSAIKREETLLNTGLAFQTASKFSKPEDRNSFVDKIADVIVQADEVNEQILQV